MDLNLSMLLDHGWPGSYSRVRRWDADNDLWAGIGDTNKAMQAALDNLVEWQPGVTAPTGAEVRATIMAWRAASELAALVHIKTEAIASVDRQCGEARLRWITATPGQAMTYLRKEQRARECLANYSAASPPPTGAYPILDEEVGITASDTIAVAEVVVTRADAWEAVAGKFERIRKQARADIEALSDVSVARDTVAGILAGLSSAWPAPAE